MDSPKTPFVAKATPWVEPRNALDLEALSHETGVPVDVLRTLAGISDPANAHLFTAESARRAFALAGSSALRER